MSAADGFTVFLDVSGAAVGGVDNLLQTINAGTTIETAAGIAQVTAALTGSIPGVGIVTNAVALTFGGITADPGGANLGQLMSAAGNVLAIAASALA